MNAAWKVFLSMSFSGGVLILALLLGKRLLKDKISRQWQYYIWLIVLLRLLIPFGPEASLLGKAYQAVDRAIVQAAPPGRAAQNADTPAPFSGLDEGDESAVSPPLPSARLVGDAGIADCAWWIWLMAALGLLIRKMTLYQGFMRYIRADLAPVSDLAALDRLSVAVERLGVKAPVELCVNPLVSSPLLTGFFHPCIVLPRADIPEKEFQCIVLHELTHYKRRDMFYKWLVQVTVCLHWFNPLVHLMSREIAKDCEFSCDEAVLTKMGRGSAQDYGKTLLDTMAAVGRYKEHLGAVTLSENKQLLKERLGAIMNFRRKSMAVRILTGALTLCVIFGAACIGVYPAAAAAGRTTDKTREAADKSPVQWKTGSGRYAQMAEESYEAGSLPLFQMAFCRLDEETQGEWLDRIFTDRRLAFFAAAVNLLEEDCTQVRRLAETVYKEGGIAYFSNLTTHMSEDMLESWLDRALEEENWAFQSVLFKALDKEAAWDELEEKREKEWEERQTAEYGAAGVSVDGKNYYYREQLVHIFLDMRPNKSFYTLNMNPKGTVNIRIVRDAEGTITGVAYMSEAEAAELLGGMEDPDDRADADRIPVNLKTVAAGETICLGEYALSEGDRIRYDISAETGDRMKVFFAKGEQRYWSVDNRRQPGEALSCAADYTVAPPAKSGMYRLCLQAPEGALGGVKGGVSMIAAAGAA